MTFTTYVQLSVSRFPKERDQMVELFVDANIVGDNASHNDGTYSISHVIAESIDSNYCLIR